MGSSEVLYARWHALLSQLEMLMLNQEVWGGVPGLAFLTKLWDMPVAIENISHEASVLLLLSSAEEL